MNGTPLTSDKQIVAIIQARALSERLPNKIFADLEGRPILGVIIENLLSVKEISSVWVATAEPGAELVRRITDEYHISLFVGHPTNVLSRYTSIARSTNASYLIRATGDNPFVDPENVRQVCRLQLETAADVAAYTGLPLGCAVESLNATTLLQSEEIINQENSLDLEKRYSFQEHVSTYLKQNRQKYKIEHRPWPISDDLNFPAGLRLTVDEKDDLILARKIARALRQQDNWPSFTLHQILDLIHKKPALATINAHVNQRSPQHSESLTQFYSRMAAI